MRRWHSELPMMMRRREARRAIVPPSGSNWRDGIMEAGLTFWRKRHPLDCGRPRCGLCHSEKFYGKGSRAEENRAAIAFDVRAAAATGDAQASSPDSVSDSSSGVSRG